MMKRTPTIFAILLSGSIFFTLSSVWKSRLQDHDGGLGESGRGVGVVVRIDRCPAIPQTVPLFPDGSACADRTRVLVRQPNDSVWVRFEVEPPGWMPFVPPVHRKREEVRAIFEVSHDDAALFT
jgi:hypothetical protein